MSEEELKTQLKKEITSLCETNSSVMTYFLLCVFHIYGMPYERYEQLQTQLQQKDNIIKEVRKYIQDRYDGEVLTHTFDKDNVKELLEILDKVEENK